MSVQISLARLVLIACALALVGGCCLVAWEALERPSASHPTSGVGPPSTASSFPSQSTSAPVLPVSAKVVAARYAVTAFALVAGTPSDAWIGRVSPWCTAAWRAHLAAAASGTVIEHSTIPVVLVRVFPSWAPSGSVGATVVVQQGGRLASLYIELRVVSGRYLVEATQ